MTDCNRNNTSMAPCYGINMQNCISQYSLTLFKLCQDQEHLTQTKMTKPYIYKKLRGKFCTVLIIAHSLSIPTMAGILRQWFPKCAPQIPRDLQTVPRGSVDTSLQSLLIFLIKGIMFC